MQSIPIEILVEIARQDYRTHHALLAISQFARYVAQLPLRTRQDWFTTVIDENRGVYLLCDKLQSIGKYTTLTSADGTYSIENFPIGNACHHVSDLIDTMYESEMDYLVWFDRGELHCVDKPAIITYPYDPTAFLEIWVQHGKIHRDNDEPAYIDDMYKCWYQNGLKHRDGGPADIYDVREIWYQHDNIHRDDGPAVIHIDSDTRAIIASRYYKNGKLHRDDGPAVIQSDMIKWYTNGELHHDDDEPAITRADGTICYYKYGKLHRDDGPALICELTGSYIWFQHGVQQCNGFYNKDIHDQRWDNGFFP